jgi:hypothetical protein
MTNNIVVNSCMLEKIVTNFNCYFIKLLLLRLNIFFEKFLVMANRGGRGRGREPEPEYPRNEVPYRGSLLTRNSTHASNRAYDMVQ